MNKKDNTNLVFFFFFFGERERERVEEEKEKGNGRFPDCKGNIVQGQKHQRNDIGPKTLAQMISHSSFLHFQKSYAQKVQSQLFLLAEHYTLWTNQPLPVFISTTPLSLSSLTNHRKICLIIYTNTHIFVFYCNRCVILWEF